MGYDGSLEQTIAFGIALLAWLYFTHIIWADDLSALVYILLFFLAVAMPLWHSINGEQHFSDNAWNGVDSYEVTLVFCIVSWYYGLWVTKHDIRNCWAWLTWTLLPVTVGYVLFERNGWRGIAITEALAGGYVCGWHLVQARLLRAQQSRGSNRV